jgi:hypothetical protein
MVLKRSPITHQFAEFAREIVTSVARLEFNYIEDLRSRCSPWHRGELNVVSGSEIQQEIVPRIFAQSAVAMNSVSNE